MPNFLAVYIGAATARDKAQWDEMDAKRRQEQEATSMQAWGQWMADNAAAIIDGGSPLGQTKSISNAGVSNTTNLSVGYIIVEAVSHEAAASLFANHPHVTFFPGNSIDVMECLAIPGAETDI